MRVEVIWFKEHYLFMLRAEVGIVLSVGRLKRYIFRRWKPKLKKYLYLKFELEKTSLRPG